MSADIETRTQSNIRVLYAPNPHRCPLGDPDAREVGTVVECTECGRRWVAKSAGRWGNRWRRKAFLFRRNPGNPGTHHD